MAQPSISSLEDLHTRWGPPPPTLDAATIAYICNGLTLERNSSLELGLRRRQGWKMAQQVLSEVAAVLVPSTTTAPSSPGPAADEEQVHTSLPKRRSTVATHIVTPESLHLDMHRLLNLAGDENKDYSAYLDMLMTPGHTAAGRKAGSSSSSSSITTDTTDEDSASASTPTIPSSPLGPTQTPASTKPPNPSPHPTATKQTNPPTNSNSEKEKETDTATAKTLHPLLLARLNAAWSNLLDLDLASRSVEHRVARDLGALRRLRGAALDELLEELVVVRGLGRGRCLRDFPKGGGEEGEEREEEGERGGGEKGEEGKQGGEGLFDGQYTAAMRILGKRFGEGKGEEEGEAAVLGEWMAKEARREAEEEGVDWLNWEGVGIARERVERELVERGVLGYESE